MPELNAGLSKDRIAADILIALLTSGKGQAQQGGPFFNPEDAAAAFKIIRQSLESS